jgi:hypothetical protein
MLPPTAPLRLSRRAPRRQRPRGRTVQIVATPGSGQGRALATARRLARLLEGRGYVVDVRSFADLSALTRWAKQCPPHASHVVCIGGDATLSAAAVADIRRRVPVVSVPNGFGNVFAQVFGYPRRPNAVVDLLDEGEVCYVDAGVARWQGHDEIFLSHRSYGFLEQVQQVAERGRKLPRRYLFRYLWYYGVANRLPGRWRGVRLYRGRRVTVTTPQRREELVVRPSALPLLVPAGRARGLASPSARAAREFFRARPGGCASGARRLCAELGSTGTTSPRSSLLVQHSRLTRRITSPPHTLDSTACQAFVGVPCSCWKRRGRKKCLCDPL